MIEKYTVHYKDVLIGILLVDASLNKHCYIPEPCGVEAVKDCAMLLREMKEGTVGFQDPIPFFENRLFNMKRWGLRRLNYQTDNFTLKQAEV